MFSHATLDCYVAAIQTEEGRVTECACVCVCALLLSHQHSALMELTVGLFEG